MGFVNPTHAIRKAIHAGKSVLMDGSWKVHIVFQTEVSLQKNKAKNLDSQISIVYLCGP
jgi:hypothetical protein